jgi:hypothetical protein
MSSKISKQEKKCVHKFRVIASPSACYSVTFYKFRYLN